MNNIRGNLTTILNFACLAVFPYLSSYGFTQDQLVSLFSAIFGLVFAYLNARFPNNFAFLQNNESNETNDVEAEC